MLLFASTHHCLHTHTRTHIHTRKEIDWLFTTSTLIKRSEPWIGIIPWHLLLLLQSVLKGKQNTQSREDKVREHKQEVKRRQQTQLIKILQNKHLDVRRKVLQSFYSIDLKIKTKSTHFLQLLRIFFHSHHYYDLSWISLMLYSDASDLNLKQ